MKEFNHLKISEKLYKPAIVCFWIFVALAIALNVFVLSGCSDEPAVSVKYGEPYYVVENITVRCPMKMRCVYDTTYDTIRFSDGGVR